MAFKKSIQTVNETLKSQVAEQYFKQEIKNSKKQWPPTHKCAITQGKRKNAPDT